MARTKYKNGDPIYLKGHNCDGCQIHNINGVNVHEIGCPDAWRDKRLECPECDTRFYPEERYQTHCFHCINPE
jgi:transcriptional regulator NrdR family protein